MPRGSGAGLPCRNSSPRPCGIANAPPLSPTLASSADRSVSRWATRCDTAFPLHLAIDTDHGGRQHDAPASLERLDPNNETGDATLVLNGDEHHALRQTRPLAYKHEACHLQPFAVASVHSFGAGDDASLSEILSQKADWMGPQRQAGQSVAES